ncbi:MAG: glycosyltransferase family 2 protein [Proteobacteria bacterium]|nr:glycosyltransferase family 2 protein [Pseudomonadota bacterium]
MRLSVLLVSYNTQGLLDRCLGALDAARTQMEGASEVIVVDNASHDGSVAHLAAHHADVQVIVSPTNVGFGRANNLALAAARGDYILLLNTDAFVEPDALSRTLAFMDAHPDVGVLGVRLVAADGHLQPSCRYFPTPWNEAVQRMGLQRWFPRTRLVDDMSWDHASVRDCDWVTGCFYLVRRQTIDAVGLFDPRYFLYNEEVDHCMAVRQAGWRVVYFPDTTVVHLGGESAQSLATLNQATRQVSTIQLESSLLYHRKHGGWPGLALHLGLQTGMDLAGAVKDGLRGRGSAQVRSHLHHLSLLWATAWRTRGGRRPTR